MTPDMLTQCIWHKKNKIMTACKVCNVALYILDLDAHVGASSGEHSCSHQFPVDDSE